MMVELPDLPHEVRVMVGERIEIPLPSYAGSGNVWASEEVRGGDRATTSVVPTETSPRPGPGGGGTSEPPALALVPERAVVVGIAPGEAVWRLVLQRPFGPRTPAAVVELHVVVSPDPGDRPRR